MVATAPLALVAGAIAALGGGAVAGAAVLAVAGLAVVDQLPRAATALAGLSAAAAGPPPGGGLRERVDRGHRALAWLLAGGAAPMAGALAVLAFSGAPAAWALGLAVALAAGLRARRYRFTAEVLPLAAVALAGPLAIEAVVVRSLRDRGPAGALAAVALLAATAAVAAAAAATAPRLAASSPRSRRLLDVAQLAANLALVPLAAAALGVFELVYQLARRLG
jgi:hypothetical protein